MFRRAALAAALAATGCTGVNPCSDFDGQSCIVLEVQGAHFVDQIAVTATGFALTNARSPAVPRTQPVALPLSLAILPGATFAGDFTLDVSGFFGGGLIGEQAVGGRLVPPGQHVKVHVDLGGAPDLGGPTSTDLAGLDFSGFDFSGTQLDFATPGGDLGLPSTNAFFVANQGLFGGDISVLIADFANQGAYAGTVGAGVFHTANAGATWTENNTGLDGRSVSAMTLNNVTGALLVAITRPDGTFGVFRSTDFGAHWNHLVDTPLAVTSLLATQDPLATQIIVVGMDSDPGILRSINDGASFTPSNSGLTDKSVEALAEDPLTRGTWFAGTLGSRVFKSTDFGANWSQVSTGIGQVNAVFALAFDPHTLDLAAGTQVGLSNLPHNTATWSAYAPAVPQALSNTRALAFFESSTPDFYVGTLGGMFHLDGNKTAWSNISAGLTDLNCAAVTVDRSNPQLVYAGTFFSGVSVSTNSGTSWGPANQGLTNLGMVSVASSPMSPTVLYGGSEHLGMFKSTNSGASWSAANSGMPATAGIEAIAVDPQNASVAFASTEDNSGTGTTVALFRTTSGGSSWSQVDPSGAHTILIDPKNSMIVFAGGGTSSKLRRSTDGGTTFNPSDTGLTAPVSSLVIDPNNSLLLYASTLLAGVFKSTNGGLNWSPATTGIPESQINKLAIDPLISTVLYASGFTGVYKSTDAAGSWGPAATGLTGTNWKLRIAPSTGQVLYAAGSTGIYRTSNGASSWTRLASEPFVATVQDMLIDSANADIAYFAFTDGPGILETTTGGR